MLMLWLRGVNPPPTWSAMVDALKIPAVGLGDLAEEVESKFLHQTSATDSGKTTGEIISYNRNSWRYSNKAILFMIIACEGSPALLELGSYQN